MIFWIPQIDGDGHGKFGLLPNLILSSNQIELPSVVVLTSTHLSPSTTFISSRYSKQGGAALIRLKNTNHFM
jgi:hypothetical protein